MTDKPPIPAAREIEDRELTHAYNLRRELSVRTCVFAAPSQLFVPVTARGTTILDNGGDPVAECFTPELAQRVADLLNGDAREFRTAT